MKNEIRRIICSKILDYLKLKIPEFKTDKKLFTCPFAKNHKDNPELLSANLIPKSSYKVYCYSCGYLGDIFSIVRKLEKDKKGLREDKLVEYLKTILKIEDVNIFDVYENYKWALLPLANNIKDPIKGEAWKQNIHASKTEWMKWISLKYNIGLKTGKSNKITVIDVDCKILPKSDETKQQRKEIVELLEKADTLVQLTPSGGKHYVFDYDEEIPVIINLGAVKEHIVTKDGLYIDTRNDNGYIVIEPSKIDSKEYKWFNLGVEIKSIPKELKEKILSIHNSKSTQNLPDVKINNSGGENQLKVTESELNKMKEHEGRYSYLLSLGGQLNNKFSIEQTGKFLNSISQSFFNPPLPDQEIQHILKSLYDYKQRDDLTIEQTIYGYLQQMETDLTAKDIMDSLNLKRGIVDKYLSKFKKEGKLIKVGWGRYRYREIIEWQEKYPEKGKKIDIEIPYFDDVQDFYSGDIIILGARPAVGKTTISMNIIKRLVDQGIKPYYLYSESGSRFMKIADVLGIKEGSYKFYHHSNPLGIELPLNGITIIDWLQIGDKSMTDTIFKHLNEEMEKKGGILFILMQLKEGNIWFAPNMVDQYPALAGKLIYDEESGQKSHLEITKIRDPKGNYKRRIVPCNYDFGTKILNVRSETEDEQ